MLSEGAELLLQHKLGPGGTVSSYGRGEIQAGREEVVLRDVV